MLFSSDDNNMGEKSAPLTLQFDQGVTVCPLVLDS